MNRPYPTMIKLAYLAFINCHVCENWRISREVGTAAAEGNNNCSQRMGKLPLTHKALPAR